MYVTKSKDAAQAIDASRDAPKRLDIEIAIKPA